MPKKETGEFEVLLGNKQLLSIFFIVVILLGVFFTMGYILGRSSSGTGDSAAQARREAPSAGGAQQREPAALGYAPAKQPEPPTETTPPPAEQAATAAPAAQPPASLEPQPGETYLQVMAVNKPVAEVVADVLKRKGFRSLVAAGPSESLFRVLVGPLADADAVAKTRVELIEAGFNKSVVRNY